MSSTQYKQHCDTVVNYEARYVKHVINLRILTSMKALMS